MNQPRIKRDSGVVKAGVSMKANMDDLMASKAQVDFECFETNCSGIIKFNLIEVARDNFQSLCPDCHRPYVFDKHLREQLNKFLNLIMAVREAENILGNCNVAVTVPGGEVKIPYTLLLTRLNTMITLNFGDRNVDFHFRVEPASPETFR